MQCEKVSKVDKIRDELEKVKKEYIEVDKKVKEQDEIYHLIQVMCLKLQEIKKVMTNCRGCKKDVNQRIF